MKIPLKAITVTYTRTLTVAPTTEMFEDWEDYPDQEALSPMPYTNVEQFEDVEIDWEGDGDDD